MIERYTKKKSLPRYNAGKGATEAPKKVLPRYRASEEETATTKARTPFPFRRITPTRDPEDFKREVLPRVAYWTTFQLNGRDRNYERHESRAVARKMGKGDGTTMIYAVDHFGNSMWVESV